MRRSETPGREAATNGRKRKQRGAIAVEFALVMPLFLCALGLVINVGLSFFARFQLTNYASAAARYCVSQVNVNQNALNGCVSSYLNSLDLSALEGLCRNITTTPTVMPGPNTNPDMGILEVRVSCDSLWSSFANVSVNSPQSRDTWMITIKSSMPFTRIN